MAASDDRPTEPLGAAALALFEAESTATRIIQALMPAAPQARLVVWQSRADLRLASFQNAAERYPGPRLRELLFDRLVPLKDSFRERAFELEESDGAAWSELAGELRAVLGELREVELTLAR